jgi:hypothetical protein
MPSGERSSDDRRLPRREIEDRVQARLLEGARAARELDVGLRPGHAEIGLQHVEPWRRTSLEHGLGDVTHPPRDLDKAVGQSDPFVCRDHRIERLPQLASQRAQFRLHVHVGQRQFLFRELDAASALAAQLHRQIEHEGLVRRIARDLEAGARIRTEAGRPQGAFANRASAPRGGDPEVARRSQFRAPGRR